MHIEGTPISRILVTGGAGFIGSNFIRRLHEREPGLEIINFDLLTYAGNPENLEGIEDRYSFIRGDIREILQVEDALSGVDVVVNFAAETHVDRSIHDPGEFILTDVYGVFSLLEAARRRGSIRRIIHISTDEVYGSIAEGAYMETDPLNPSSPYSASKAGGDRLAYSYFHTYGLPVIIVRPSNNYGPYQYPEKLIPFFITRALTGESLPLYGDGSNRRDWLHVDDTVEALITLIQGGIPGEVYNLGAGQEMTNLEVSRMLLALLEKPESLIQYVEDRKGHDFRYAVNWDKIKRLGWSPRFDFRSGLAQTVSWYRENEDWWRRVIEKREYMSHLRKNYK